MSERSSHYGHEVQGAIWSSWERQFVYLTDGNGNYVGGVTLPESPDVVAMLERGGRIVEPGTMAEELAWWKDRKVTEIERHAEERLERNEPEWSRSARLARIALVNVCPQAGPITLMEIEQTHYDAATLGGAKDYIDHVQAMDSIDAVRAFAPEMMGWPKYTI